MDRIITINVDYGMAGGFPRKWFTTQSYQVKVSLDDTLAVFEEKIKAVMGRKVEPPFRDGEDLDHTKTVGQNGLKNGDHVKIFNGKED